MGLAYYNEHDEVAAAVLRRLIAEEVIAFGDVDTRSITDVRPGDLGGYTQCHFFAGGGLWSVAARMAGWPDDRPLWTGSCPCQPFSAAGKGGGVDDPRHLWPDFFRLVRACRPPVVMGEQVAGAPGYGWFDGVRADLAGEGFASRVVDIPACAVDAPHIRQRLYWVAVADADACGRAGRAEDAERGALGRTADERASGLMVNAPRLGRGEGRPEHELRCGRPAVASADAQGVTQGDAFGPRLERQPRHGDGGGGRPCEAGSASTSDGGSLDVADAGNIGSGGEPGDVCREASGDRTGAAYGAGWHVGDGGYGRNGSFWSDAEWLACHDGKARRTQSGLRLLVDGMPGRVGLWRIAGNAIVAPLAAEVIRAFMDVEP